MGKIPTLAEYLERYEVLVNKSDEIYRYMNFDQISEFSDLSNTAHA
jgi:aconitate hydratase 2/2-methylisocitrate dehydratase